MWFNYIIYEQMHYYHCWWMWEPRCWNFTIKELRRGPVKILKMFMNRIGLSVCRFTFTTDSRSHPHDGGTIQGSLVPGSRCNNSAIGRKKKNPVTFVNIWYCCSPWQQITISNLRLSVPAICCHLDQLVTFLTQTVCKQKGEDSAYWEALITSAR